MLQSDEVDDDYFTPAANTTLANIFGGPSQQNTNQDNESLRYTPPKKQDCSCVESSNAAPNINKETKACECILAYAFDAFEWEGNKYIRRGKLGFAILKYATTETYNLVLYDSNKTTISNFTVHTKNCGLFVMTSSPQSIAYFDNDKKYWSLLGKEEEITKIVNVLKNITVEIKNVNPHLSLSEPTFGPENIETVVGERIEPAHHGINEEKESDTDSSVNKRTKASILNRMANMGHSVLPTGTTLQVEKSSDSSDSVDFLSQPPKVRPKPSKIIPKRNYMEKKIPEISNAIETKQTTLAHFEPSANNSALYTIVNGQLVPVSNTNVIGTNLSNSNNELNLFITEQRMNNNELRINVNRTADKVEQVLDIVKSIKHTQNDSSTSNFQIEIMQKLLSEYETKIKNYEEKLASKCRMQNTNVTAYSEQLCKDYDKQITELKNVVKEKDEKIIELNDLIQKHKLLQKEIDDLRDANTLKDAEIKKNHRELNECKKENNSSYVENNIKKNMNELFHSLTIKIDDSETYSGKHIKKMIASIIKKSTIQYLNEPDSEN